jgi:putative membrane protein
LTTLTATTAAGRQGYQVQDVAEPDAVALADTLVPGLLDEFRA